MDSIQDQKLLAEALQRLERLQKQECFDPQNPLSRPTDKQKLVIEDFGKVPVQIIKAGNQSGKSQTVARIISWVLTNTHPYWKRPAHWNQEPLLIIIAGRTGKQIEDSLLPKIRDFLEPGTYKEVRAGNMIQRLELETGDRIIFQSMENPHQARERLQSYVAHVVWCDELPPNMDLVRELLIRVQARRGFALFSFTPTTPSPEIQKYVDGLRLPEGKVYQFSMLDNPLYRDEQRKQELLARYSYLSEEKRRMVFEGDWLSADNQVYHFVYDRMVEFPEGYSPLWRHVESVDPAISSALGLTLWAENPHTGVWYCVRAEYIKGLHVPTEIVQAVQTYTRNLNIVKRISDYAPWFVHTANSMGIRYQTVNSKNHNRKQELIKKLQEELVSNIRISPTCQSLIDEFQDCRWSDRADNKMVNSSSYHLLDSAQYFVDVKPKKEIINTYPSFDAMLYQEDYKRRVEREKQKIKATRLANRRNAWRR